MTDSIPTDGLAWVKASASTGNGQCVRMAALPNGDVAVGDSKNPGGPPLVFTRLEIAAWLDGVRAGEFDEFATTTTPTTMGA